jgi:biopolymer transport protein ExbD
MNNLSLKKLIIPVLIFSLAIPVCQAQSVNRPPVPKQQKSSANLGPKRQKRVKVQSPKSAGKSKKEQEVKKKKLKKDFSKYVKENQKRSIEIQTPEVKARMKQNIKDADTNYKVKHKNSAARTRRAARKYR